MAKHDPTERFKDIPALMNPTTPAMRRLRARLEDQPIVIPRERRRRKREKPGEAEERCKNSEAHARRRAELRVQVPAELVDPHPLIEHTRRIFAQAKPDSDGIIRPEQVRRLDLEVSPAQFERALLVLDTLIKALEARGHEVRLARRRPRSIGITVAGERLTFSLHEMADQKPHELMAEEKRLVRDDPFELRLHRPPRWDYFPSGRLRLRLNGVPFTRGCWTDGMRYIVEDCLHHLLCGVTEAPAKLEARRIEQERLRQEEEEAERQREEQARKAEQRRREQQQANPHISSVLRGGL